MTTQPSPEDYYSNLSEELYDSPPSPVLVQSEIMPETIIQERLVDPVPMSDADKFLIFGGVAVVAMVSLCFIAWQRSENRREKIGKQNSPEPDKS